MVNNHTDTNSVYCIMQCPLYHSLCFILFNEIIEFASSFASLPDFEKLIFIMSPSNYYLSFTIAKFVYNAFCLTNKQPRLLPSSYYIPGDHEKKHREGACNSHAIN